MSTLAEISQRLSRLGEVSGVMNAMKSLSLMETRKLARVIDHQRALLAAIETAATDFLHHFPIAEAKAEREFLLLIGSERGFCGNFNERVVAALDSLAQPGPPRTLLTVGHRLEIRLQHRPGVAGCLPGATVTEELSAVLDRLMEEMAAAVTGGACALSTLAHDADGEVRLKRLLPLALPPRHAFSHPPRLQLPPPVFLAGLIDHYLLAALSGLLYESFAAESRRRLAHMERALDSLDETLATLSLKRNALRQERIVEEIEVILSGEQLFREVTRGPSK